MKGHIRLCTQAVWLTCIDADGVPHIHTYYSSSTHHHTQPLPRRSALKIPTHTALHWLINLRYTNSQNKLQFQLIFVNFFPTEKQNIVSNITAWGNFDETYEFGNIKF